jgi:hypothetical protein
MAFAKSAALCYMPAMADGRELEKLIADAQRIAESRDLPAVIHLLELASAEAAKAGDMPPGPDEPPR